jgi:hypothetical protein
VVSSYDPSFYSDHTNGWILSGDNGPTFLEVNITNIVIPYSINATDWITDYVPKFGLGHKIMVEIPSNGHVFQEAMEHLTRAESSFNRWDAKGVYSNCREIGKLLDTRVKEKLGADSFTYTKILGAEHSRFFSLDIIRSAQRRNETKISKSEDWCRSVGFGIHFT